MTNSCGNCKYREYREGYLYPYRCKKEKAVSYSEEKWMDRVHRGHICEKWDLKRGDKMTREEAIDVLKHNYPSACFTDLCEAVEIAIKALSAELQRKKGKWISDRLISTNGGTYGVRRCSECEAYYQDVGYGWNYCPKCGADMREPEDIPMEYYESGGR